MTVCLGLVFGPSISCRYPNANRTQLSESEVTQAILTFIVWLRESGPEDSVVRTDTEGDDIEIITVAVADEKFTHGTLIQITAVRLKVE